ncbi:hypothetical protein DKX38_022316 [Salix brachista]|uniref:Ketose-bisphosphate aldolase class-II family protein n=1 Tax=Salix brachista TaxID=2182728 RepID=A0A5N5KB56_9ROSI|nr:hypothetical protein DKX38_022316 [Salix brachista]
MINQLLAGVHIASWAEAMALGARLGLNTRMLFDLVKNSGGTSWMFENRVPHMLDNDYTPYSALDIFVKDLGIVTRESSSLKVPLHIATVAHQLFLADMTMHSGKLGPALPFLIWINYPRGVSSLAWKRATCTEGPKGSAAGWGRQDDAGVVKVYETLTGVKVEGKLPVLKKEVVLQSLPPEWPLDPIDDIHRLNQSNSKTLVVLDDDPTGTQTVHDIEVLTEWLVPAGDTEFARDASFGYKSSNLREWAEEKTRGRISASSVSSISINLLRKGGPDAVCDTLCNLQKEELRGKSFLCRTAASFVSTRIGIIPKAPILPKDLGINKERKGGLIVVEELKLQCGHFLKKLEVSVDKLAMKSLEEREEEINRVAEMANLFLGASKDTLIMTSRELINGKTAYESLEINFKVSSALVEIVRRISTRPRYILAKLGPESRHPGVPYIVFPGNVGDSKALADVVKSWALPSRLSSTKELLLNAERGGYAVGAFNVYNMEGVEAVVAAAEEENSPAILQIHPSALKQGGIPLVACCVSAAEQANGFDSLMVDGSHLSLKDNIAYTKYISLLAHSKNMLVEAELGRLSGIEDDLTVEDYEARLTDVNQAEKFIDETGIDALAVCIGNVHGKYPASGPNLRLDLLKDLHALSSKKGVFLVLHGASGLSEELIKVLSLPPSPVSARRH